MNQHLQAILNFIQRAEHLSDEEKAALLKAAKAADKELEITSFKLERTEKVKHTTAVLLEETIEELEKKRKAIEAQNRELEIESSLEKVRTVAMGMRKRDDMLDICRIISGQLELLGIKEIRNVQTAIFYTDKGTYVNYEYYKPHDKALVTEVDYTGDEISVEFATQMIKGADEVFIRGLEGQQVKDWLNVQKTTNVFIDNNLENAGSLTYYWFSLGPVAIGMSTYHPLNDEEIALFKRFRNVFDLAYRRYLDIEKAEAQAREAQIEAALEKVRSRSLAMHKSDELQEVVHAVFERLNELNFELDTAIIIIFTERSKDTVWWLQNSVNQQYLRVPVDYADIFYLRNLFEAKENKRDLPSGFYSFEQKNELLNYLFDHTDFRFTPPEQKKSLLQKECATMSAAVAKNTAIHVTRYVNKSFSEKESEILKKFSNVFEQAYTRFLDLQKAEAQAREAQIETGLERVRSRSLAMHNTSELQEVIHTVHKELLNLNIAINGGSFIAINSDIDTTLRCWGSGGTADTSAEVHLPLYEKPFCSNLINKIKNGPGFFTEEYTQEGKKEFFTFLLKYEPWSKLDAEQKKEILSTPGGYTRSCCVSQHTSIFIINHFGEKFSVADNDILKRFAKVFDQTYTRFLDLQKAEGQAREAQIQLALERVRARTMAMQRSDELREAVLVIYEQLQQLNFESKACNIIIIDKESGSAQYWVSGFSQEIFPESYTVPYLDHPYHDALIKPWKQGDKYVVYEYTGKMKQSFDEIFFTKTEFRNVPEDAKNVMIGLKSVTLSTAFISYGALQALGPEPLSEEKANILKRFAKVFEQTYTRFLDLQKAEAQARESQIQLALERVRARTMAMQKSDELMEASNLLLQQVQSLGIPVWACGYNIWEIGEKVCTAWMSVLGAIQPSFRLPLTEHRTFIHMYESRLKAEAFYVEEVSGEELGDHYKYMFSLPDFKEIATKQLQGGDFPLPQSQTHHVFNFKHGNLIFLSAEAIPQAGDIFKRFTAVFEQTYTRFLDLQKAEAQARQAQIEASLERVRASAMAMHRSDELSNVLAILFEQFDVLKIQPVDVHLDLFDLEKNTFSYRATGKEGKRVIAEQIVDLDSRPEWQALLQKWKKGKPDTVDFSYYPKEVIRELMAFFPDIWAAMPEDAIMSPEDFPDGIFDALGFCKFGYIGFHHHRKATEEEQKILIRFANEFERLYQRFLDLQKAEAQARESQIQLALERVRARTMAMQKSNEMTDVAGLLFEQVSALGIKTWTAGFNVWSEDNNSYVDYITSPQGGFIEPYTVYTETAEALADISNARKSGVEFDVQYVEGEKIKQLYLALTKLDEKQYEIMLHDGVRFPSHQYEHFVFGSKVSLMFITYEPVPEAHDMFKRLGKVFEQTYTRFLDLQKAEAQARESQIELGLERVRARAMAMQKSDELSELVDTVFKELTRLDFALTWCIINIIDEPSMSNMVWAANPDIDKAPDSYHMKFEDYPFHHAMMEGWKERKTKYVYVLEGAEKKIYDKYLFSETEFRKVPAAAKAASSAMEKYVVSFSFSNFGGLQTVGDVPLSDANLDILSRFGKVFDLTYTRFNDLKQAEAQSREAQIEAALERVRSRSMAMHHSNDLQDVIRVLSDQLLVLGLKFDTATFAKVHEDASWDLWISTPDQPYPAQIYVPYVDQPIFKDVNEADKRKEKFFERNYTFEEKNTFFKYFFENTAAKNIPDKRKQYVLNCKGFARSVFLLKNIWLSIANYEGVPFSKDENAMMQRFANVFEQTYTRFLDLQKAEAQAREAKIETALEKVRSRTMAMQRSDELGDVAEILFKQVKELGIHPWSTGFNIWQEGNDAYIDWITNPSGGFVEPYTVDLTRHPFFREISAAKKRGEDFHVFEISGEPLRETYALLMSFAPKQFEGFMALGFSFPTRQLNHYVFGAQVSLMFITHETYPEAHDIFKRFGKVFEQTYTRFLDLQKAEAQAREAQIEAALERVRSRTMGMQRSTDLQDTASILFSQVQALGAPSFACGFNIWDDDRKAATAWMAREDGIAPSFKTSSAEDVFFHIHETAQRGESLFVREQGGDELETHYRYMATIPVFKEVAEKMAESGVSFPSFQVMHCAFFSQGYLMFITYQPVPRAHDIFKRFAKVFEQTYTRFLDLQKAEAQGREAIKRASVDRVRAEIASMRTTNDLERITPLIWNELTTLGVPFVRCGVFIMDEEKQLVETHLSTPDGRAIASFTSTFSGTQLLNDILPYWQRKEVYKAHWDEARFMEQAKSLVEQGAITSGEKYLTENRPTDLYLHFLPFLQGMLYAGNTAPLSDDALQLMQNLADAFSTAYARYEDFNKLEVAKEQIEKTLVDLKQAQQQLVQSEKMASLGELTAGIAHEIQNPLNFVNNFSDVNKELLEELKEEADKGNIEEIKAIANDVINNEEKINHHGKRADAIVKNMLQHSRSSGAAKELTDINKLADEYLRLSYHGLRAKDKSFNADFKTELDSSVGKINVIPQDIGRVLLNLINNAFYATNEKKKTAGENYKPLVSVLTKKINNNIEIAVTDNGKGIPASIKEKIFQPFFTTKPTGQGTGLGLSLSYDIIKAHNGEIRVESKEGEGSEFVIQLPV